MNDLIEKGLTKGLISFDAEQKNITYIRQNKRLRFTDPEEKVRANAYLSLVCDYGYSAEQIDIEVTVEHRVPTIFSDIVVYADKSLKKPVIVVECKREEASQGELDQAVEQGFGYANSMDADFVWMTSGLRNDYFRRDRKAPKERVANRLADLPRAGGNISRAKYVKGGQGGFELKTVEENELTRIFKQAHDALWAGGKRNPAEAFDELDKLIFCKIWDERKTKRKNGEPYDFQVFSDDKGDDLKVRIHNLYLEGRKKDAEVFKEDIRLSNAELQTVVGYLAATNLNKTDLDSKGRAFETFMTGFFRGEFGQYFTPRNIVKFIVDALPITNDSKVLDTSCGSGGFLLHALAKVRAEAGREYPDQVGGDGVAEGADHHRFWHDFAEKYLFGIEISEGIARTAKMNMIIHDDGHTNVIAFDGLESIDTMREKTKNNGFKADAFDFIITNPPFGSKVKFAEKRYLENYTLGKKGVDWIDAKLNNINLLRETVRDQQTTEVLFIEQCHRFLKPGGYLAMVIPDSILTNSSMQYVRDWIEEHWRIVAVVSLPQFAFAANGAGVKSSVLFLKKYNTQTTAAIQAIKTQVQDDLFGNQSQGQALEALLEEKKAALKKGDQIIQDIENALIAKLETLEVQGTLTAAIKKSLKAEAKAEIKAHIATEAYEEWKQATNEDYNERIANLREALEDDFLAKVKAQVDDYPIFMAIAEDIGYDATGRPTAQNELDTVTRELARFLEQLEAGDTRPFA
ncbi:N-6 DNA methylase [Vibrio cholerae]|nr:N-6 DNA methylase [Vibrio cholerae]